nr:hypothetical protein [Nocardia amamiensis]
MTGATFDKERNDLTCRRVGEASVGLSDNQCHGRGGVLGMTLRESRDKLSDLHLLIVMHG